MASSTMAAVNEQEIGIYLYLINSIHTLENITTIYTRLKNAFYETVKRINVSEKLSKNGFYYFDLKSCI